MSIIILNQKENEIEQLSIKVIHNSYHGRYELIVNKEFVTLYNNYSTTRFIPFAEGNFKYIVTYGRISQKKLNNLNNLIEQSKNDILKLWNLKRYNTICQAFKQDAEIQKLI